MKLERGVYVRVRLMGDSDWCEAFVVLAGGSSVALFLKGAVRTGSGGAIFNFLPLSINYEAQTVTSLFGDEYELEVHEN